MSKPPRPEPPKSLVYAGNGEPEITAWAARHLKGQPVISWTAVHSQMAGAVIMNFYTYERNSTPALHALTQAPPKYQMKLSPDVKKEDWPEMAERCMILLNLKDEV